VALKKVALRRLEDGIPNQALREIKALQEIEDNQHVSLRTLMVTLTLFERASTAPSKSSQKKKSRRFMEVFQIICQQVCYNPALPGMVHLQVS